MLALSPRPTLPLPRISQELRIEVPKPIVTGAAIQFGDGTGAPSITCGRILLRYFDELLRLPAEVALAVEDIHQV